MLQRGFENNHVYLVGEAVTEPVFSHELCGERFYHLNLSVRRLSGNMDQIPLVISERLIDIQENFRGVTMEIFGQFRSHHFKSGDESRLAVRVFVYRLEKLPAGTLNQNEIRLDGYICKDASYRITPSFRELSDLMVAVNRQYGKSDFIPCIVWGRNAHFVTTLEVGQHIRITGRIQSREYIKKTEGEITLRRKVYEVSVNVLECVEPRVMKAMAASVAEPGSRYRIRHRTYADTRPRPEARREISQIPETDT